MHVSPLGAPPGSERPPSDRRLGGPSRPRRWRQRLLAVAAAAGLGLGMAGPAAAATVRSDDVVTVAAGETVRDNLYAFGSEVRILGTVEGDVVAFAGRVVIAESGRITGDLLAATGGLIVEGLVEGDVRGAASVIEIRPGGRVLGEVVGAAMSIGVNAGAEVEGALLATGYQGLVDGRVGGDVGFAGSGLALNGIVEGDVDAYVEAPGVGGGLVDSFAPLRETMPAFMDLPSQDVGSGLHLSPEADVRGSLAYTSTAPSEVPSARFHRIDAPTAAPKGTTSPAAWATKALQSAVAHFLVGLVVVAGLPGLVVRSRRVLAPQVMESAAWGCGGLLLAGALSIGLLVAFIFAVGLWSGVGLGNLVLPTVAGTFLGGTLLTFGVVLATWLGRIPVLVAVGARLAKTQEDSLRALILPLAIGSVIYGVLSELPFVGVLVYLAVTVVGFGALIVAVKEWLRPSEPGPFGSPEPVVTGV